MSTERIRVEVDYDVQVALHEVATSANPLIALNAFRDNQNLLKDWRIIYADEGDWGPFKLRRCQFSEKGIVATAFRGKSLWILDIDSVNTDATMGFLMGTGTFVDSNAASYIRSLAYRENISGALLAIGRKLNETFSADELVRFNPYLYLWEAQRNWTEKTIKFCRQAVAALHALSLNLSPLDEEWGGSYRTLHRDRAEAFADTLLAEFQEQLNDGLSEGITEQVELVEAMLVRTKIIEATSQKSAQHKMDELIQFMHDELSTMMLRELIVCADILCRGDQSALSKKLNSLHDQSDPLAVMKNGAWDLFIPRAMDYLANTSVEPATDFYLANLVTFDTDVADIIRLTELRAIALHRTSQTAFPFLNEGLIDWLEKRLGEKRMLGLAPIFQKDSFDFRTQRRTVEKIRDVLAEDRLRLLSLLDEAATRRSRQLLRHELFCTFIPLMPRGLIVQYFVRINQHDDDHRRAL